MKNVTLPDYEDYRAEVDLIAPQASHLIAIRRHMTAEHPELLLRDMQEQLPPDVFETCLKLKEGWVSEARKKVVGGRIEPFCLIKQNGMMPFAYIATPDTIPEIRKDMSEFSRALISSYRMKFAPAVNEPEIALWFKFFHELGHGLVSARAVSYQQGHFYYEALEETVCDSFSTLQTLRKFSERAIPYLHVAADMRLSAFYRAGPEYFTGPAIRAIVDDALSGKLDLSTFRLEGGDGRFALAQEYATRNFLDAGDVAAYRLFLDSGSNSDPDLVTLRECFTAIVDKRQPPLMEVRTQSREWQKELYDRSIVIEEAYTYPTRRTARAARMQERRFPGARR